MARDLSLPDRLREEARDLQETASQLLKCADHLDRINGLDSSVERAPRKPANWRVADDLERILEVGKVEFPEDQVIEMLASRNLVRGKNWNSKIANARKAVTMGINNGYIARRDKNLRWVPSVRINARVRKTLQKQIEH